MKRWLTLLGIIVLIALSFGLGILYPILNRPPLVVGQNAVVAGVPLTAVDASFREEAGGFIDIRPAQGGADTLLIFYSGGLVRPQAYQWLGTALAPLGVRTVIPAFPFDLAVSASDRAEILLEVLPGEKFERVVLAGHSLGGAMAARYAHRHPEDVDALILMAAYSAEGDDLSVELPTLVLAAENDGLASLEDIRAGMTRLPPDAELVVIEGSVHAFFGRYGPQEGDGLPTVTRANAEAQILAAITSFLAQIR